MPQLDPSSYTSQIFWLIVSFSCLYFVVSTFITPKIADILKKRQVIIDGHINKANTFKEKARISFEEYEKKIDSANKKTLKTTDKAFAELNSFINDKKKSLQEELAQATEKNHLIITKEKEKVIASVNDIASELAMSIMDKIGISGISKTQIEKTIKNI